MTIFDEAKADWNILLANRSWASPVFGDTYYVRYPIDVGTQEALTYKRSIFKGDDTVHAWDAKGVRQKIIQRIIETQERTIRPWYGELSFFSDQIKFLPPLPESELDFILRTSLLSFDEEVEYQRFKEARDELLQYLDPEILPEEELDKDDFRSVFRDWDRPEDRAKKYSKVQIELYGLLNIIKDRMFILSDDEILQVIEMLFNIEQADKFLVKRFIDPKMKDEDLKPFLGQENPDIRLKPNFILKYIGGGDSEYYKRRIFQLWLRNLLDFDKNAVEYVEEVKFDLIEEFPDEKSMQMTLLQAIKLHKWETHKERLSNQLRAEYASQLDFKRYMSDLIHLINLRNELFSEFSAKTFSLPINPENYDPKKICYELGVDMVESIMTYLNSQIPEPEGVGGKIQSRLILNKRINNLKKFVLPDDLRDEILSTMSGMYEKIGTDLEKEVEEAIREPYRRLVPRGEHYFEEMETEVRAIMQETGDQDIRKELAASTDDPQTLVKQYGNQAFGLVGRDPKVSELYSTILGLKGAELMFSGNISMTPIKRRKATQSLVDDLFHPQFDFLKLIKEEEESGKED